MLEVGRAACSGLELGDDGIGRVEVAAARDLDVDPKEMDKRLDDMEPDLFEEENSWRRYVEEQYLKVHTWLRDRRITIPNPGWRSEYVEEVVAAGYATLLGD